MDKIIQLYVWLFARKRFARFNQFLFRLALGGLGVLNYRSSASSGELSFLKRYLPSKSGAVIDVGANIGGYSKEVHRINDALSVYAFEPHPKTFMELQKHFNGVNGITIFNQGLSSAKGTLKLYDYPSNDGSQHASLFEEVITDIHGSGSVVSHEVDLITLDDFVAANAISEISLLKVDTEGNELEVLKGARDTLERGIIKAVHFEFNEMNVISRTYFRDFEKTLTGFRLYRLLPNEMLEIQKYNPLYCELFAFQNIVAILEEK